jgi:hypothetical protein
VLLNDALDERVMRFGPDKSFLVKNCYYVLNFGGISCVGNPGIWHSFAPKKCSIFVWLALHNRLSTKDKLASRGVMRMQLACSGANKRTNPHVFSLSTHLLSLGEIWCS